MFKVLSVLVTIVAANTTYAAASQKYYTIKSVKTVELPVEEESASIRAKTSTRLRANSVVDMSEADQLCLAARQKGLTADALELSPEDLGKIVMIGKEIWKVVEANKPVVHVNTDTIAVLPMRAECWRFLSGWGDPVVKRYRTTFKNLYGMKVVDFQYKVLALTGGSYRGKGKYLARVAIVPEIVDIAWGYEFNASLTVPTVLNYGTVVDPVASVELELSYSIDTVLKHVQRTSNFLVKGNGEALAL